MSSSVLQVDRLGKYRVKQQIGKGSYGTVFLVECKENRKQYVMKNIDLASATVKNRLAAEQEAGLLSRLHHPNIVSYKESFQDSLGVLHIVMGYCEGGDLSSRLKGYGQKLLPESQVVEWFVQIALALQYLHERNILHRDLKTQNIFLSRSDIVKVGDLGIARVLDGTCDLAHTIIGTPYYMSPELFANQPYNQKSDIWALGCCVYEMASLKHAFSARSLESLMCKVVRGKVPSFPAEYSPELTSLVHNMLATHPQQRPSVHQILRDTFIRSHIRNFIEKTARKKKKQKLPRQPKSGNGAGATKSKFKVECVDGHVAQDVDVEEAQNLPSVDRHHSMREMDRQQQQPPPSRTHAQADKSQMIIQDSSHQNQDMTNLPHQNQCHLAHQNQDMTHQVQDQAYKDQHWIHHNRDVTNEKQDLARHNQNQILVHQNQDLAHKKQDLAHHSQYQNQFFSHQNQDLMHATQDQNQDLAHQKQELILQDQHLTHHNQGHREAKHKIVQPLSTQCGAREDAIREDVSSARLRRRRNRRAPFENVDKQELKSHSSADLTDCQEREQVKGIEVRRTISCINVTGNYVEEDEVQDDRCGLEDYVYSKGKPRASPCIGNKVPSEAVQSSEIEELFTLLDSTLRLAALEKGNHKTCLEKPLNQENLPLSSGRLADRARALRLECECVLGRTAVDYVLDRISAATDSEEIEEELKEHLGEELFHLHVAKLYQLKLCEDSLHRPH